MIQKEKDVDRLGVHRVSRGAARGAAIHSGTPPRRHKARDFFLNEIEEQVQITPQVAVQAVALRSKRLDPGPRERRSAR